MATDHNQQGRRGHFHRGRRGPDRRGPERRQGPPSDTQNSRAERTDRVDVEQIMRDIRSRIAQRSGIELSNQQIQELAARRLEAVLDPRGLNPALLDQLRRSAGERTTATDVAPQQAETHPFDEANLYDSPNGLVRFLRRLLNPILRLFINPTPIAHALALQSRFQADLATREAERDRRQAEWNALHYQLLQRLVMEVSRVSIEDQSQALRIESLAAKVDFNERRVRAMEGSQAQSRAARPQETTHAVPTSSATPPADGSQPAAPSGSEGAPSDQPRRRRRRRRGRRSSGIAAPADAAPIASEVSVTTGAEEGDGDTDEGFEDDSAGPNITAGPETEPEAVRAESAPVQEIPEAPPPIQPPPIEPPQE